PCLCDAGILHVPSAPLLREPARERPEAAATTRGERPGLFDQLGEIRRRLLAVPAGEGYFDHSESFDCSAYEQRQRGACAQPMQIEEDRECFAHSVWAGGRIAAVVEPAAARHMEIELLVGAAERSRAQCADQAH